MSLINQIVCEPELVSVFLRGNKCAEPAPSFSGSVSRTLYQESNIQPIMDELIRFNNISHVSVSSGSVVVVHDHCLSMTYDAIVWHRIPLEQSSKVENVVNIKTSQMTVTMFQIDKEIFVLDRTNFTLQNVRISRYASISHLPVISKIDTSPVGTHGYSSYSLNHYVYKPATTFQTLPLIHDDVVYHFTINQSLFIIKTSSTHISITRSYNRNNFIVERTFEIPLKNLTGLFYSQEKSKLYVLTRKTNHSFTPWFIDPYQITLQCLDIPLVGIEYMQFIVICNDTFVFNSGGRDIIAISSSGAKTVLTGSELTLLPPADEDSHCSFYVYSKETIWRIKIESKFEESSNSSIIKIAPNATDRLLAIAIASTTSIFIAIMVAITLIKRYRYNIPPESDTTDLRQYNLKPILGPMPKHPQLLFDHYLTEKTFLSSGAFGEVSRAVYCDGYARGYVAIKSLFNFNTDELKNEAAICCSLNHPNILPLTGILWNSERTSLELVFPFMKHGNLLGYLDQHKGSINGKLFKSFAMNIIEGMVYLTTLEPYPIVHRDLACRNCMVDRDLSVKIADFGLSRPFNKTTQQCVRSGKTFLIPVNSAPESMNELIFNEKSDVWSFGHILLEFYSELVVHMPRKVHEVFTDCHNMDPNKRPTFIDLKKAMFDIGDYDFDAVDDKPEQKAGNGPAPSSDEINVMAPQVTLIKSVDNENDTNTHVETSVSQSRGLGSRLAIPCERDGEIEYVSPEHLLNMLNR